MSNSDLIDSNLTTRTVRVRAKDVVYVKGIFEASLGVGIILADANGDGELLTLAAPHSRERDLDELLSDLKSELGSAMSHAEPEASDVPSQGSSVR